MNYLFFLSALACTFSFSQKATQTPESILENCYIFLGNQKDIKFENHASLELQVDSVRVMENFSSITMISDRKKVHSRFNNGRKTTVVNYDQQQLSIVSIEDGFYSKYEVPGLDLRKLITFFEDSLKYDFPLANLFVKDGYKDVQKIAPKSYDLGLKMYKGFKVHHLVFEVEDFSWQMFISADENRPVPLKVVINDQLSKSQYIADLSNWDFSEIDAEIFNVRISKFIEIK